MGLRVSPKTAFTFTKMSVALLDCWPPPPDSSKLRLLLHDVLWTLSLLNALILVPPLINGIFHYRDQTAIVIQNACFLCGTLQAIVKMIVCRLQRHKFQALIAEMEEFVELASPAERKVLESYIERSALLHLMVTFAFYGGCSAVILGPIVLPQSLPTFAVYPFAIDSHPVLGILYLLQAINGLQAAIGGILDCQAAVLLWYASARFEILAGQFEEASDARQFARCIRRHQNLLRYAAEVAEAIRFIVLTTVAITVSAIVFAGLQLIFVSQADVLVLKLQFTVLVISVGMELFVCSWPADNLMEMSLSVGLGAYSNSIWTDKSGKDVFGNMLILVQRCQKPVIVTVGGFLPFLSLTYYMSILSSSFSYFTTLRIVLDKSN